MWRLASSRYARSAVLTAALVLTTAGLMLFPRECLAAARAGLELCFNVILPSLFPFFVLSSLVVDLGFAGCLGRALEPVMRPLFRVGGACASALVLGFIGGYPVGARTAISLYRQGMCSRTEAMRLLAFCNNSGPAFILGVVGAGVFASSRVGVLLYLTHMAASCLVGVIFRFYGGDPGGSAAPAPVFEAKRFTSAFTQAITGAMTSTLNICAFVLFFTVILRLLTLSGVLPLFSTLISRLLGPLGMTPELAQRLLMGAVELSSGVSGLAQGGTLTGRVAMAAFILGWAGLSVHCQVLSFLGDSGLSPVTYFTGKLLHGVLSAGLTALVTRFIPLETPVSHVLAQQVGELAAQDFSTVLPASVAAAWCLLLGFFFFAILCGKGEKSVL